MRVALCVSGSIKNTSCLSFINLIKAKYDTSVFIHTWDISNKEQFLKTTWSQGEVGNISSVYEFPYTSIKIDNFEHKRDYLNNVFNRANFTYKSREDIGSISMYYSINEANKLKSQYELENNMTFDCVVRLRFDSNVIGFNRFEDYNLNEVNIPEGRDWGGVNDQFAFGNSHYMNLYSEVITNINNINHRYHPETMLKNQILYRAIPLKRIKLEVKLHHE